MINAFLLAPVWFAFAALEIPAFQLAGSDELIGNIPTACRKINKFTAIAVRTIASRYADDLAFGDRAGRIARVARQRAFARASGSVRTSFRCIHAVKPEFASVDPAAVAIDPHYAHSLAVGVAAGHRRYSPVIVEEREASCSQEKSRDYCRYDKPFERSEGTTPGPSRLRWPLAEFYDLPTSRHAPPPQPAPERL